MDDGSSSSNSRWTMPLQKLGTKQYYLGIFFKVCNIFVFIYNELSVIYCQKKLTLLTQIFKLHQVSCRWAIIMISGYSFCSLSVVFPNEKKRKRLKNQNVVEMPWPLKQCCSVYKNKGFVKVPCFHKLKIVQTQF